MNIRRGWSHNHHADHDYISDSHAAATKNWSVPLIDSLEHPARVGFEGNSRLAIGGEKDRRQGLDIVLFLGRDILYKRYHAKASRADLSGK